LSFFASFSWLGRNRPFPYIDIMFVRLSYHFLDHFHGWTGMDSVEVTGVSAGAAKGGLVVWTNSMSTMMLGFLADLVASGARTSSGFKSVHHNQCAKALNDHFKLSLAGDNCSNHLKKWRKIWGRIVHLKNLSGALWDEDTSTIRLSDEHYAGHCNVRLLYDHFLYFMSTLCYSLGYFCRPSKQMLPS
jgi:hypothetical protein